MAYAIDVQADVVDIRIACNPPEHLFVDTNVWFWYAYSPGILAAEEWRRPQINRFLTFLTSVIKSKGYLYHSGLQLAELLHQIEKIKLESFNSWEVLNRRPSIKPKEFRHGQPVERQEVVSEVQAAWADVIRVSKPIDCIINPPMTMAALDRFAAQPLDGYDIFFIESLLQSKITTNVLTDDGDFTTIPGITVYTANDRVIQAAAKVDKLL